MLEAQKHDWYELLELGRRVQDKDSRFDTFPPEFTAADSVRTWADCNTRTPCPRCGYVEGEPCDLS